jgi:DNA-binding MarR family transcriptional regulator
MPRVLPAQSTPADGAPAAWARYRDNLARHLIGIARDLQIRLMNHLVADRGHRDLRPSFGLPISLVSQAPRPLSELARDLSISPQAASQIVTLAERAGYLARQGSASDRRARVAVLTGSGQRLVEDAVAYLRELEGEHARRVGQADYHRFVAALAVLADGLGLAKRLRSNGGGSVGEGATAGPRPDSIGVIPFVAAEIEQTLMRATSSRGHAGLKLSHSQILLLIGASGVRLHQLAELHRVSRQAISATARDLEVLGYLRREPDPRDRRGVVVRLTPRGTRLIEDSVSALDELERPFRDRLAAEEFAVLERVARTLYGALEFETGILSDAFPISLAEAGGGDGRPAARANAPRDLSQLAAQLRDRLGSRDAARLAAHLTASP